MNNRASTSGIAASTAVLLSLGLVGCGSDDSTDSATSATSSSGAVPADDLPARLGAITVDTVTGAIPALQVDLTGAPRTARRPASAAC